MGRTRELAPGPERSRLLPVLLLLLVGCSKAPPEPLPSLDKTITSSEATPWPFKVSSLTYTCTDTDGGATAVINGTTYGLTGREALNWRIRGYGEIEYVLHQPYSEHLMDDFEQNVTVNCIYLMHKYDEAWKKQNG